MTDEELAEIEARAQAATPGPWFVEVADDPGMWDIRSDGDRYDREVIRAPGEPSHVVASGCDEDGSFVPRLRDAGFIAHARTDIPRLLAEIRRLKGEAAARANAEDTAALARLSAPAFARDWGSDEDRVYDTDA